MLSEYKKSKYKLSSNIFALSIYARQIVLITYQLQLIKSRDLSFVIAQPVFICKADSSIKLVEVLWATAWYHVTFWHTHRITLVPDE